VSAFLTLASLMAARAELYRALYQINEGMVLEVTENAAKRGERSLAWTVRADRAGRLTELMTDAGFGVSLGEPHEAEEEPDGRLWCRGTVTW